MKGRIQNTKYKMQNEIQFRNGTCNNIKNIEYSPVLHFALTFPEYSMFNLKLRHYCPCNSTSNFD
jgi:hypothetical protein